MKLQLENKVVYLDFLHRLELGGWKTVARLYDSNSVELGKAAALCHPGDKFDKRIGRKLALTRLLEDAETSLSILLFGRASTDQNRKARTLVWAEYLKRCKV